MGLDAGGRETCCVYSLRGWDHVDRRMLNLVLSSVAAQFISRPRQARVQLLSVSEKTEMVPRVSGGGTRERAGSGSRRERAGEGI